jgi:ATP-dependent Clp protease ATP-binding subunit ClpA
MANIPPQENTTNEQNKLLDLKQNLKKKIFGQDEAIDKIVSALYISKTGLKDIDKPIASFLFTGPTGVGKTELAKQLAENLNINFVRFDMSEYQQAHTASSLIGSPAGYIGYEKGGLLTNIIKKNPYTVFLLDEIDKAHKDLVSLLLQVMDRAKLTDNNGESINFENVILIMTSNLGQKHGVVMGFEKDDTLNENKAIKEFFTAEFRNRLDNIVAFAHINKHNIGLIVHKFIEDIQNKLDDKNISLSISSEAKEQLITLGYDKDMGARPLKRVINKYIKEPLSYKLLVGDIKDGSKVIVQFKNNKFEVSS